MNDTMMAEDGGGGGGGGSGGGGGGGGGSDGGAYARTLMTLAVGLVNAPTVGRCRLTPG